MPIDYSLDHGGRLIRTKATGVLTDDEIFAHKKRLLQDERVAVDAGEISDVREVTELAVTVEGIREFVAQDRHAGPAASRRLAIVATEDLVFGMARMYQNMSVGSLGSDVAIFRDIGEATAWLEHEGEADEV